MGQCSGTQLLLHCYAHCMLKGPSSAQVQLITCSKSSQLHVDFSTYVRAGPEHERLPRHKGSCKVGGLLAT